MRLTIPPGITKPLIDLFNQINSGKADQNPQSPVNIMTCNSAVGMPAAADYPYSLVIDTHKNQPAWSNGVVWMPLTSGAHY